MKNSQKKELDSKAHDIVIWIYRAIKDLNLLQDICNTYAKFCRSPEAKRVGIKYRKITKETKLRLLFEMLCFTTFFISIFIAQHVAGKKIFQREKNDEAERYFNLRVGDYLSELCESLEMTSLREITLISIKPDFKYGYGDEIDPIIDRIIEYMKMRLNKPGSEIEFFGKQIGKSLDPYNYPVLDLTGGELGLMLVDVAKSAYSGVFA